MTIFKTATIYILFLADFIGSDLNHPQKIKYLYETWFEVCSINHTSTDHSIKKNGGGLLMSCVIFFFLFALILQYQITCFV